MPKPLSQDLRLRILEAYDEGHLAEDIAEMLRVHPNTVRRYVRLRDATGSVEPVGHRGGHPRALSPEDREALRRYHQERPDAYLRELVQRLAEERGVQVSIHTIGRELNEMGFSRKKNTSKQPSKMVKSSNSSVKPSGK